MQFQAFKGIMIPFVGTVLGSACVFFLKDGLSTRVRQALLGFAGGVMVAASVWSLLIPSIDLSVSLAKLSFLPAAIGFWAGIIFLLLLDKLTVRLYNAEKNQESPFRKNTMLILSVFLHNLPEGMAVGVVFAGLLSGNSDISLAGAITLAVGIAIQNFPEGAIISLPVAAGGEGKIKSFVWGVVSGIIEPIGAVITLLAASVITPALPYFLSFAAGAMIYAVVAELIPEMSDGTPSDIGIIMFSLGFTVMMALDVALG